MKKQLVIFRLLALWLSLSLFAVALAPNPGQPQVAQAKRVALGAAHAQAATGLTK